MEVRGFVQSGDSSVGARGELLEDTRDKNAELLTDDYVIGDGRSQMNLGKATVWSHVGHSAFINKVLAV